MVLAEVVLLGLLALVALISAIAAEVPLFTRGVRRVAAAALLITGLAVAGEVAVFFGGTLVACGCGLGGNLCGLFGFVVAPLGCFVGAGCAVWILYRKRRASQTP